MDAGRLLDWVEAHPPHWAEEELEAWDGDVWLGERAAFVASDYWCDAGVLDVMLVAGTDHPEYQGRSWRWFLHHGRRMRRNLALLAENPGYYLARGEAKRPSMYFVSLDGHRWFVHGDGNHRTCIARFFFAMRGGGSVLDGVSLRDVRVDRVMWEAYGMLEELVRVRRLPYEVRAVREKLERRDGPGWQLERFRVRLEVRDVRTGEVEAVRGLREAEELARRWGRRRWWFFGGGGR